MRLKMEHVWLETAYLLDLKTSKLHFFQQPQSFSSVILHRNRPTQTVQVFFDMLHVPKPMQRKNNSIMNYYVQLVFNIKHVPIKSVSFSKIQILIRNILSITQIACNPLTLKAGNAFRVQIAHVAPIPHAHYDRWRQFLRIELLRALPVLAVADIVNIVSSQIFQIEDSR